ncbi:MAG: hypothetical protein E6Q37_06955 [Crocinitomicaceae bacterium]|nr:MAG: hypothetical protein E6Q37_06955 [Crocinitomicaceae bacterium]
MKAVIYVVGMLLLITACVGKEVKSNLKNKPNIEYPAALVHQLDKFPLLQVPYSIDSVFFDADSALQIGTGTLYAPTVKLLSTPMASDEVSRREQYYLNDYFKIAKAKKDGKYAALKANLDIGMTENAVCNPVGRIEFGDTAALLIWEIKYESFPACPSYFGHDLLGSYIQHGKVISCMHLASRESGADAPMFYETFQLAKIDQQGRINIKTSSKTQEDSTVVEQSKSHFHYQITTRGFKLLK